MKSLTKRVKEIDALIDELKDGNNYLQELLDVVKESLNRLRNRLDRESSEMVSPFLSQLEALIVEKATLTESKRSVEHLIKIRRSLSEIDTQIIDIDNQVTILKEKLSLTKDEAPSIQRVCEKIADYLSEFLKATKVKSLKDVAINNSTFLPIVRNQQYHEITSGGIRTLTSVGYILSILQYAFANDSNHPKLVMIDTVGKYLGKTTLKHNDTITESDKEEGISSNDKSKYIEMYKYFIELSESSTEHQLIVVDNDLPETIQDTLQQYIVKHFDDNGQESTTKGFIDDAP
ncbi:hypothetical protein [Hymenobacter antarcticus]|uniref:Exonuclease SbcC n=1 Tax=Hymenobacter antarcticus TaxID=486270 RepID=A0ABP7Q4K0_9BACT